MYTECSLFTEMLKPQSVGLKTRGNQVRINRELLLEVASLGPTYLMCFVGYQLAPEHHFTAAPNSCLDVKVTI